MHRWVTLMVVFSLWTAGGVAWSENELRTIPLREGELIAEIGEGIILEREIANRDTRVVGIVIEAAPGVKAKLIVERASLTKRKARQPTNRSQSNRVRNRTKVSVPWELTFLRSNGEMGEGLSVPSEGTIGGVGLLQADACSPSSRYRLRLVLLPSSDALDSTAHVGFILGEPAPVQRTLFKYPSEKDPGSAVLLMNTTNSGPHFINMISWRRGKPQRLDTAVVSQYFYGHNGLYTRTYLSSSRLSGEQVTFEHLNGVLSYTYGVCVRLTRSRQQLEGYR